MKWFCYFYYPSDNIFELYIVFVQLRLAASKTNLDMQCNNLGVPVVLRFVHQIKSYDLRS